MRAAVLLLTFLISGLARGESLYRLVWKDGTSVMLVGPPVQKGKELRGYEYPGRKLVSARLDDVDLGKSGVVDTAPPPGETSRTRPGVAGSAEQPVPSPRPPMRSAPEEAGRILASPASSTPTQTFKKSSPFPTAGPARDMGEVYFRQRSEVIARDLEDARSGLMTSVEKLLAHERNEADHGSPGWTQIHKDLVAEVSLFERRVRALEKQETALRDEARKAGASPGWLRP